jgi:hypothetical protein
MVLTFYYDESYVNYPSYHYNNDPELFDDAYERNFYSNRQNRQFTPLTVTEVPGVNTDALERRVDEVGSKISSKFWQAGHHNNPQRDFPFKCYRIVNGFEFDIKKYRELVLSHLNGAEKRNFKVYQYNFQKKNRRYSTIIITANGNVKAIYLMIYEEPKTWRNIRLTNDLLK